MTYCWEKLSHLSKKLRLSNYTSFSVSRTVLFGQGKKGSNFHNFLPDHSPKQHLRKDMQHSVLSFDFLSWKILIILFKIFFDFLFNVWFCLITDWQPGEVGWQFWQMFWFTLLPGLSWIEVAMIWFAQMMLMLSEILCWFVSALVLLPLLVTTCQWNFQMPQVILKYLSMYKLVWIFK